MERIANFTMLWVVVLLAAVLFISWGPKPKAVEQAGKQMTARYAVLQEALKAADGK